MQQDSRVEAFACFVEIGYRFESAELEHGRALDACTSPPQERHAVTDDEIYPRYLRRAFLVDGSDGDRDLPLPPGIAIV
jgi:hypothetical protein